MNENIDLTKILDGCPRGTELYSPLLGVVKFNKIIDNTKPIIVQVKNKQQFCFNFSFTEKGHFYDDIEGVECLLFPSKNQRDWSKFERFWDKPRAEKFDVNTLRPFDKVLVRSGDNNFWTTGFFSYIVGQWAICVGGGIAKCIPYNEETKHLIGTTEDCPEHYKWWEE